jgi:hypothetical protein
MAFDKVDPKVDFPAQERDILRVWEETCALDPPRARNRGCLGELSCAVALAETTRPGRPIASA